MKTYIIVAIGIFSFLLNALLGCSFKEQSILDKETVKIDSLLFYYQDSMVAMPMNVVAALKEKQQEVVDSFNYYNLLQTISRCFFYANQLDSAFLLNDRILSYCKNQTADNQRLLKLNADAYNARGTFLQEINQWDSAVVCLRNASEMLSREKGSDRLPIINIYINLADCSQHQGSYEWAGFYYRKALFLSDSLGIGDKMNYPIYSGLARLYQELENYPLSDSYYRKAEMYWDKGTAYEKYYFANSRGNYYYVLEEYDKALDWFRKANEIVATFPQPFYRGIVEGNIGEIYLLKGQPDSARYYLNRSVSFMGQSALRQPGIKFYMDGLFASLALQEGNLEEASRRLNQPYDTLHTDLQYQYYHNKRLEELYSKKRDFAQAYYYRNKADICNDSLRSVKIENSIRETDFRYRQDTTLLRKDIRIANAETKAMKWKWLAGTAGLGLVIVVLSMIILFLYTRRKRERFYKKQIATVTGLRMAIVRNRIAPHYIFNVLNAIMPAFRQHYELSEPVGLLIDVLRGDLLSSEQLAIPLEKEITFVRNYLKLKMLSNPDSICVKWNIAPEVPMETMIPSMSIQIPVENAVKYAFGPEIENPKLSIMIDVWNEFLRIAIEDNGVGYNPAITCRDERSTGSGLKILYRTTELLNTHNLSKMHFSIINRKNLYEGEQGTRMILIIPFNYNYEL